MQNTYFNERLRGEQNKHDNDKWSIHFASPVLVALIIIEHFWLV